MKKSLKIYAMAALIGVCSFSSCENPQDPSGGGSPVAVDGRLPGKFSVSQDKKVSFSQGNLQYRASTKTWRFAQYQFNFVGGTDSYSGYSNGNVYSSGVKCSNNLISPTYDGWIDLFGWGTSGWDSGYPAYMPYSTSTTRADYIHGVDLTGDYIQADWGIHNVIVNGGRKPGLWRLLTDEEWKYLRFQRPNADKLIGSYAAYDAWGILLLPDNFNLNGITDYEGLKEAGYILTATCEDYDYWKKNYGNQYAALEKAGAVFLPQTHERYGTTVYPNMNAGYWTSTHYTYNEGEMAARATEYDLNSDWSTYMQFANYGMAVRLVQEVK